MKKVISAVAILVLVVSLLVPTYSSHHYITDAVSAYMSWRLGMGHISGLSYDVMTRSTIDGKTYIDVKLTYTASAVSPHKLPLLKIYRLLGLEMFMMKPALSVVSASGVEVAYLTIVVDSGGIQDILVDGIYKDGVPVKTLYAYSIRSLADIPLSSEGWQAVITSSGAVPVPGSGAMYASAAPSGGSQAYAKVIAIYTTHVERPLLSDEVIYDIPDSHEVAHMPLFIPMLC